MPVEDPLLKLIDTYCNVNSIEAVDSLPLVIHKYDGALVSAQLIEAIEHETITPREYEDITGEEYETPEELRAWLKELWQIIFQRPYPP